jgi:hypothetical protein
MCAVTMLRTTAKVSGYLISFGWTQRIGESCLLWNRNGEYHGTPGTDSWRKLIAMIEEDFGKLLSIKARHKLLFFKTENHVGADRILDSITSLMLAYPCHLAGEQYMAIERTMQGAFRYWFEVPCDGRLESVQFNKMGAEPLPWPWAK